MRLNADNRPFMAQKLRKSNRLFVAQKLRKSFSFSMEGREFELEHEEISGCGASALCGTN
jgi:hypothetical protein